MLPFKCSINHTLRDDLLSRRHFLASIGLSAALPSNLFSLIKAKPPESAAIAPANILFINVDDLGWTDLGCMGSAFYETPNIDQLANEGMLFTEAYAAAANCAPSRACVFTGQYTPRHGVYTVGHSQRGKTAFRKLIPTPNTEFIAKDNLTFAALLRDSGYSTCHIGKWHISKNPLNHGFETNIGGYDAGMPTRYFSPYDNPCLSDGKEGEYLTDRLTDEAIAYLKNHDPKRPFLLSLQFYSVHTPWQAKPDSIKKYKNKRPTPNHFYPPYAAMIEHVDTNVGRLLNALKHLNLSNNTLVLLTSDNGGIHHVSHQSPLRGEKGSYYEGGIRVPLIVRWPGQVRPASRCDTPVCRIDFYPTFLEATGASLPKDKILDGVSLLPVLKETKPLPDRPLFWHFPVYLEAYEQGNVQTRDPLFRTCPGSAMRMGRWSLHEYFEDGRMELYDLKKDIGQRCNLVETLPEITSSLHKQLKDWRKRITAPVPLELNPDYDPHQVDTAIKEFYRQ